eukprot:COSAG06_NODE_628_length_13649_cov_20.848930_4_plen_250_part_00
MDKVTAGSVVWPGVRAPKPDERSGALDPRIGYRPETQTYYIAFDNGTESCAYRQTQLSTTSDPFNQSPWVHHGQVLAGLSAQESTAGVGFLFRPVRTTGQARCRRHLNASFGSESVCVCVSACLRIACHACHERAPCVCPLSQRHAPGRWAELALPCAAPSWLRQRKQRRRDGCSPLLSCSLPMPPLLWRVVVERCARDGLTFASTWCRGDSCVIGDGGVGKTSLLMRHMHDEFDPDYVPTIFDDYEYQ